MQNTASDGRRLVSTLGGAWAVVAFLWTAACSGDGTGLGYDFDGGTGDGPIKGGRGGVSGGGGTGGTQGGAPDCDALASGYCGAINRCAPLWIQIAYGDVATCVQRLKISCLSDVNAPQSAATAANAATCASGVAAVSCADLFNHAFTTCEIPGPRANGSACGANSQCQSGFCRLTNRCGTCAKAKGIPVPPSGKGQAAA